MTRKVPRRTGENYNLKKIGEDEYITNLSNKEKELLEKNISICSDLFPPRNNSRPKWISGILATIEDKFDEDVKYYNNSLHESDLAGILDMNRDSLQHLLKINLSDCVLMVTDCDVYLGDYENGGKPHRLSNKINEILKKHNRKEIVYLKKKYEVDNVIAENEEYSK